MDNENRRVEYTTYVNCDREYYSLCYIYGCCFCIPAAMYSGINAGICLRHI